VTVAGTTMTALTAGDDAPQHPGIGATPAAVAPVHDERADARDPQELRAYVNDLFHRW
jgi:hypothetical protein